MVKIQFKNETSKTYSKHETHSHTRTHIHVDTQIHTTHYRYTHIT